MCEDVHGGVITVGDADEGEGVLSVELLFEDWRCPFSACDAVVELVLAPDACWGGDDVAEEEKAEGRVDRGCMPDAPVWIPGPGPRVMEALPPALPPRPPPPPPPAAAAVVADATRLPPPSPAASSVFLSRARVRRSTLRSMSQSPKIALEVVATNCLEGRSWW